MSLPLLLRGLSAVQSQNRGIIVEEIFAKIIEVNRQGRKHGRFQRIYHGSDSAEGIEISCGSELRGSSIDSDRYRQAIKNLKVRLTFGRDSAVLSFLPLIRVSPNPVQIHIGLGEKRIISICNVKFMIEILKASNLPVVTAPGEHDEEWAEEEEQY